MKNFKLQPKTAFDFQESIDDSSKWKKQFAKKSPDR